MSERLLSARAAAAMIGKTERTVRRWVESGKLEAQRDPTSGEFRIRPADLEPWLPESATPAAPEPAPHLAVVASPLQLAADEARELEAEVLTWTERAVRAETQLANISTLAMIEAAWLPPQTFRDAVRALLTGELVMTPGDTAASQPAPAEPPLRRRRDGSAVPRAPQG